MALRNRTTFEAAQERMGRIITTQFVDTICKVLADFIFAKAVLRKVVQSQVTREIYLNEDPNRWQQWIGNCKLITG